MRKILTFLVPELEITYQELYTELAERMSLEFEDVIKRFAPDEAVTALRYHRRLGDRRSVVTELAERLGVSPDVIYAACSTEGAHLLLSAMPAPSPIA